MLLHNFLLKIAYEGTNYFGWQKTAIGPSIEETLQITLEKILQHPVILQAASRTDRGVHAESQWVNFFTMKELNTLALQKSLNALLPTDIRILAVFEMPDNFHPTLNVVKKEYHYHICAHPFQLPARRLFSWHVPFALDRQKIRSAIPYFLGSQDFSSCCGYRKGLNYSNTIREIFKIEMHEITDSELCFKIEGNHFLYKMVRTIVGTLIDVGKGKIKPESIGTILTAKDRTQAGVTAPAHGLTLKRIYYPMNFLA